MSKCKCGGKLKSSYSQYPLGGWKCLLFCSKSKWEIYGGGFGFSKRDAYKAAFDKLQKYEEKFNYLNFSIDKLKNYDINIL